MSEVVQIQCPRCRNALRVPVAWTHQPMRCKFCQQIFEARRKPVGLAAGHVPTPQGNPIAKGSATLPARGTGGSLPLQALLVAGVVFAGVGVAAVVIVIVLGPALQQMFQSGSPAVASKTTPASARTETAILKTAKATAKADTVTSKEPFKTEKAGPSTFKIPKDTGKSLPDIAKKPPETAKKKNNPAKKPPDVVKKPPEPAKEPPIDPRLRQILDELMLFPVATGGRGQRLNPANLPTFPDNLLETYASGYTSIMDFRSREAEFPLRAAVARTIGALNDNDQGFKKRPMIEGKFFNDPKQLGNLKNQVKNEQDNVAQKALVLKDLVKELLEVGEKYRDGENKRCQALFDYTVLKLKARVIHVYEYNYTLALIRSDSLAPLEDGNKVYRLVGQEKVTINEGSIKQYVKDLKKGWPELAKNYPDSPWAEAAAREQTVQLGLSWQPAKQ